jgi:hypothetical protein
MSSSPAYLLLQISTKAIQRNGKNTLYAKLDVHYKSEVYNRDYRESVKTFIERREREVGSGAGSFFCTCRLIRGFSSSPWGDEYR